MGHFCGSVLSAACSRQGAARAPTDVVRWRWSTTERYTTHVDGTSERVIRAPVKSIPDDTSDISYALCVIDSYVMNLTEIVTRTY